MSGVSGWFWFGFACIAVGNVILILSAVAAWERRQERKRDARYGELDDEGRVTGT